MDTRQFDLVVSNMRDYLLTADKKGDFESESKLYRIVSLILTAKNLGSGSTLENITALLLNQTMIAEKQLCLDKILSNGTLELYREYDSVYTKLLYKQKQINEQYFTCRKLNKVAIKIAKRLKSKRDRNIALKYLRKFRHVFRSIVK